MKAGPLRQPLIHSLCRDRGAVEVIRRSSVERGVLDSPGPCSCTRPSKILRKEGLSCCVISFLELGLVLFAIGNLQVVRVEAFRVG